MSNVWFLVPARAGSKAIPKKNIRVMAGKPLITYVLETLQTIAGRKQIIVSTDDEEIKELVDTYAEVHLRSAAAAVDEATLDEVALEVVSFLKSEYDARNTDLLVTIQPTSPFTTADTIQKAIDMQRKSRFDSVLTVTDDRHLRWTYSGGEAKPLYKKRVNRQQMEKVFAETGGVISTTIGFLEENQSRIGEKVGLIEVGEKEGLDIDTYAEWALAEYWMNKLRIVIRVNGGTKIGFGHLYRALAIAQNIHSHEIIFATRRDGEYREGKSFLSNHYYPTIEVESDVEFVKEMEKLKPDMIINDILDTEIEYIEQLKDCGIFVVNLEDMGEGNRVADLVINDLYPDVYPKENHWYGVEYAILNPSFERVDARPEPQGPVNNILLAFGGTDPSNLTVKTLKALVYIGYEGKTTVVVGPGHTQIDEVKEVCLQLKGNFELFQNVDNMAVVMKRADLAITSAGRTVTELMVVGVPTIAMCQNTREMRHDHASGSYGVVNLGLGESITPPVLGEQIKTYLSDEELRVDMYKRMRKAVKKRSNHAVVSKIMQAYELKNKNSE